MESLLSFEVQRTHAIGVNLASVFSQGATSLPACAPNWISHWSLSLTVFTTPIWVRDRRCRARNGYRANFPAPFDMILLHGIGQTLDAENELIEFDPVGMDGIAGRRE